MRLVHKRARIYCHSLHFAFKFDERAMNSSSVVRLNIPLLV
jgi:hypothetical protein